MGKAPRPRPRNNDARLIGTSLEWKPDGDGWRLFSGRRCFGRVIPAENGLGRSRGLD
jgi:hypothetical protein